MKKLLLLFSPLLLVYSCKKVDSNDLKDDVPYAQYYYVGYDKSTNSTDASAYCRVRNGGGSKVEFSNGAGFKANGTAPSIDLFDKAIYRWHFNGMPEVDFLLTKNSGAQIANNAMPSDISNIDFGPSFPATISKAAGFNFTWTGDALNTSETMTITIASDSGTIQKDLTSVSPANSVTFSSADLQKLKPGNLNITVVRDKDTPLDNKDGDSEGVIKLRYTIKRSATLTQ